MLIIKHGGSKARNVFSLYCISIVSGIIIMDGLGGFRLDISSKTKEMAERKMCVIIIHRFFTKIISTHS